MFGETGKNTHLPGKRVVALGVLIMALIVSVIIFKTPDDFSKDSGVKKDRPVTATFAETDTDGDGLKDWEEILWKTSPKNADTDGDGIGDREEREIALETERAEQKDAFGDLNSLLGEETPEWKSLSYTDQVSRTLLTGYLSEKATNQELTAESVLNILRDIPPYTDVQENTRLYTVSDFSVSPNTDTLSIKKYGNDIGSLLVVPEGEKVPHELLVIQAFIQTNDIQAFQNSLEDIVARHDTVIAGLQQISVPVIFGNKHAELLNALVAVRNNLFAFQKITDDPFVALANLNTYADNVARRAAAFKSISDEIGAKGIVYNEDEPGALLTQEP